MPKFLATLGTRLNVEERATPQRSCWNSGKSVIAPGKCSITTVPEMRERPRERTYIVGRRIGRPIALQLLLLLLILSGLGRVLPHN